MIEEEKLTATDNLLRLLAWSVHGGVVSLDVDSEELRLLVKQQAVQGLVAEYMISHSDNQDTVNYYKGILARGFQKFHTLMDEQERISALLCDNGIPHAILKGAAAAIYYPKPERRTVGDIDLIVSPERFEETEALLLQKGYRKEELLLNDRHISFYADNGIEIELHRRFSSSTNKRKNELLDQKIYNKLSKKNNSTCEGYSFAMLPPVENGLVLLAHFNQHLREGIGFRHVLDWMVYVEHELDDKQWQEHFRCAAKDIDMEILAITLTKLCQKYLGMSKNITWCDSADQELVDELFEYILKSGNFGRGIAAEKQKTAKVFKSFINPVIAFKRLQGNGLTAWKAAREHWFLRPFAWIYQIGRTIRMGIERKATFSEFKNEYKQSRREIKLLRKLHVS